VGLAAFFVPNSLVAYSQLPKEKNNKASSLTQLFRNLGGSFGIATATTFIARRTQFHQTMLIPHVSNYDSGTNAAFESLLDRLSSAGLGAAEAASRAEAMLYRAVTRQAELLAYRDAFWLMGALALVGVPLALLIKPGFGAPPKGAH
jgi:DHA2 family multidrug resistance protein